MEYILILFAVFVLTPFILKLSVKQDKKLKANLKNIFLFCLITQLILGFLNWESFNQSGKSGYQLAISNPNSFLGLFFLVTLIQIILLIFNFYKAHLFATILSFLNSVLIFISMIKLSNIMGYQVISLASVSAVFLVLFGNVVSLTFINEDKNLLKKYLR